MLNFHRVIIILLLPLLAQSQPTADSLFAAKAYEAAARQYNAVMKEAELKADWEAHLLAGYRKAECLQKTKDLAGAISLSNQLVSLAADKQLHLTETCGNLFHKLGVYYYLDDDYQQAQRAYAQAIAIRRQVLGPTHLDLSRSHHNLGLAYFEKGNYEAGVRHLRNAINIRKDHDQPVLLAQSYQELGIVYLQSGDYNQSLAFHETALNLLEHQENKSLYDIGRNYTAIGVVERKLGRPEKALASLEKALPIYIELFGMDDSDVADSYHNIGNVYDDLGDYDRAIEYYRRSLAINRKIAGENSLRVSRNYNNLGFTHARLKQWTEALNYQKRSLAIRQEHYQSRHPAIANNFDNIGDMLLAQHDLTGALQHYQSAIINMFVDFDDPDLRRNPDLSKNKLLEPRSELLTFLSSKANTFRQLYDRHHHLSDLTAAFDTYLLCDELINTMRQGYESTASQLFLLENVIPVYEAALETTYLLHTTTSDPVYLDAAFRFMEKSKSVLLYASRQEAKAKWVANIPDSQLSRENDYKADINYYEQQLRTHQLDGRKNDSVAVKWQNQLLLLRQDFQLFTEDLEQRFPQYYREKYNTETVSLPLIAAQMNDLDCALVEYFFGEKNGYAFVVAGDKMTLFQLPLADDVLPAIKRLLQAINLSSGAGNTQANFTNDAFFLYKKLWQPFGSMLKIKTIVIPDGPLAYLPFDALLTAPANGAGYKDLPWLLRRHQLSYAYSGGVLLDNLRADGRKTPPRRFLGVAPVYKNSSRFAYLANSAEEVENINHTFGGDQLIGAEARKAHFLQIAPEYKIIHISSHAAAIDSNTLQSWIGFIDDEPDHKLYLSDLYPLQLHADLVVLSACETSRGRLSRGEGIMSLARGFAFSGCQSMLTTLWPVNHHSTAQVMQGFYEQLGQGQDKQEALYRAKLAYLDDVQTDQQSAHPYYWSAYTLVGNVKPIAFNSGIRWWMMAGGMGLAALLWMGWRYKAVWKKSFV